MTHKPLFYLLLAIAIPVAGYGIMHLLAYVFPLGEGNDAAFYGFTVTIIALGLITPYLMLKTGFFKARLTDRREKKLKLKDIPKEQRQIH